MLIFYLLDISDFIFVDFNLEFRIFFFFVIVGGYIKDIYLFCSNVNFFFDGFICNFF